MKKIKAGFRRTICIFLAAVSLSMSVTSSYYGATTAYAAEAGISIELLELLLASLGFTATNIDDLYSVQKRLNGAAPTSGMSQEELAAYQEMCTLSAGEVLDLTKEEASGAWSKLKARVSSVIYDINKATIDKDMEITSVGNIPITYKQLTASEVDALCGNLHIYSTTGSTPSRYSNWDERNFPVTIYGFIVNSTGRKEYLLINIPKGYFDLSGSNCHLQKFNDSIELVYSGGSINKSIHPNHHRYVKSSASQPYLDLNDMYLNDKGTTLTGMSFSEWINDAKNWNFTTLHIYSAYPVYESFEDYVAINDAVTSNPVNGFLYGASSAALAIGGTIALRKGGAITQEVADAISALKAENPDATDDEINETVAGVLAGIGELDSSIEEGNDIAASSNSWLEKIHDKVSAGFDMSISAIHAAIMALGTSVTSKLDDILAADYSAVIHGQMTDVLSGLHDIDAGLDSLAGDIGAVVGGALGEWTQTWENSFDLVLGGWTDTLDGIADHIASLSFPDVIEGVLTGAVDVVWPDVITLDIPDILGKILEGLNSLSIPNYMNILERILDAIQNIFGLDMVAIQAAALGLTGALDGCFPDLGKIRDIFAGFHFSDSSEYPVIKVQTPQIIKEHGYDKDYIILCDFSDYAVYCVWVRRLCRLMIWLAFAYTIFSHFKVRFSIT